MADEVRLSWGQDELTVPGGITVAAAGFLTGRRVLQRSRSLREPRGYFCGIGRCFSCAMAIDGVGRDLACLRQVQEGMRVEVLDGDPRPPTIAASEVVAAPAPSEASADTLATACDVLVIGSGVAGRAAFQAATQSGARVLGVTADLTGRRKEAINDDVFLNGLVWGAFASGREWTVLTGGRVLVVHPAATVVCTGASEVGVAVRHGTRPGVMTATAMRRLLGQGVMPGVNPFLYGQEPFLGNAAAELRQRGLELAGCADPAVVHIADVVGNDGVASLIVEEAGGRREIPADALVFCTPPHPHLELVQTAGADLYWDETVGGHIPAFDRSLQTSVAGLFVAGGIAGAYTATQARLQGAIAGRAAAARSMGEPPPAADWAPVLAAARATGIDPLEPRAWAAGTGDRATAPDQWLRDRL